MRRLNRLAAQTCLEDCSRHASSRTGAPARPHRGLALDRAQQLNLLPQHLTGIKKAARHTQQDIEDAPTPTERARPSKHGSMDPLSSTEEPAPPRKKRLDDDHRRTNEGKTIILFGLLLTDLVFNSTLEYDEWDSYPTMFGIQVFIEICTFAVVFLMLCETYPFRVGLLDALLAEFRSIFWVHPLYVFWSLIVGIYRIFLGRQVSKYSGAGFRRLPNMWDTSDPAGEQYTYLSHTHKILAAIYYFINIRAAVRLGDGVYYAREQWVTLFHRTGGSRHELRKLLTRRHNEFEDDVGAERER